MNINVLKTNFIRTHFRLARLAHFCTNNYNGNVEKRKILKSMWEIESLSLIAKFTKQGTDEAKRKEAKIIAIPDDVKTATITDYLDRCKLRHGHLYYKWRSYQKQNGGSLISKLLYLRLPN